ncbi:hypothetical protein BN946_scf184920.g2 [Trametes cinnabarina]|uniref:CNNM transmembrane domain-containing protein n=1 Tax=Pycnoporus cinnabarinus TaxID=5643 RepID=A0A060SH27_PYCCI|nr:hypothetical protein BN946_scf184920.g2 [Trametes cinnabarina]
MFSLFAPSEPQDEPGEPPGSPEFWYKLIVSIALVLAGGVFAGLTLGLMGLDELHLRVLAASSDSPEERKNAQKGLCLSSVPCKVCSHPPVLRLLGRGRHWVLVVLLLGNVIVNESLPIFLDSALGGGIPAVAISTTMIVIFGIIPQAVSVRYGLSIGASCAPIVLAMMYLFAPVAWPIAKLLDYVLGHDEAHTYKKAELKSFLAFHRQGEEPLRDDEISILNGVLELNNKKVEDIMTPMNDVVTISADRVLDHDTVDYILRSGYSRIPVHKPGHPLAFLGLLLVKQLSVYDPSRAIPVSEFPLSILPEAPPTINCFQALDYFQTGRAHLLLLSHTPGIEGGAIGVITLEDIIEEMISEEIVDETDRYEDNVSKRRAKRTKNAAVMKGIIEYRGGRTNSVSDRTPLLSRAQSPMPPSESERAAINATVQNQNLDATASAVLGRSPNQNLRPGSNLNPQYGSVIIGSPREGGLDAEGS